MVVFFSIYSINFNIRKIHAQNHLFNICVFLGFLFGITCDLLCHKASCIGIYIETRINILCLICILVSTYAFTHVSLHLSRNVEILNLIV